MESGMEEQLWNEFRSGQEEAFGKIYDAYFRVLYNYASKFTTDKDLVKDCIHDLFIKLWEKRQRLKETNSIKYYLFKALRHTMLDALTRRKKVLPQPDEAPVFQFEFVLPYESQLIDQQWSEAQKQRILEAINTLTQRQKEAIFLRFYNNLSYEEIASIMSLNLPSSYNLVYRALSILRENLVPIGLFLLSQVW